MLRNRERSITLVLGGVRSGKSRYAQQLAELADRVVFVATANAVDEEMRTKIQRHRDDRPQHWQTLEEPFELAEALRTQSSSCDCILIDCLTIFAANLLERYGDDTAAIEQQITLLCDAMKAASCDVVLVSNEVGSGVVPAYPLGRRYRDLLGEMNQQVASIADNVLYFIAGLPMVLKGRNELAS